MGARLVSVRSSLRIEVLAASLCASWLASCSEDAPLPGGPCATNRDCLAGEACIGGSCQATERLRPECTKNSDCSADQYCDPLTRTCKQSQIVSCTSDEVCPKTQRCNPLTGGCIDGERQCTEESNCASVGLHCDLSVERCRECGSAAHCPDTGATCVDGKCVPGAPPAGCANDPACNPPSTVCEGGSCVPSCSASSGALACVAGTLCDSATGRCVPGTSTCQADPECGPPARICESTQCIPGCEQVGGLVCTGGFACNATTGRCEPPAGCSADSACTPPLSVCEGSQCVPGCGRAGGLACGAGTVCDTGTGRCVALPSRCSTDAQCGSPAKVCETGQCVPGCGQSGGIQCGVNSTCEANTGRCSAPVTPSCTSDAQCNPPATLCDTGRKICTPGCSQAGCAGTDVCNATTGRCGPAMTPSNGAPLGDACRQNSDCASTVCFDFAMNVGKRCVASCGTSADCPAGFTCYDQAGARLCVSAQLFRTATFARPSGSACSGGGECKSNFCYQSRCVETCSESAECTSGSCAWSEVSQSRWVSACQGPFGAEPDGAACVDDTECESGACVAGECRALCASTGSCPNGSVCTAADYTACRVEVLSVCLEYQPNLVKVCADARHGADPVGAPCTGYRSCRSAMCHVGIGQCTDTCSRDSNCPATHRCKAERYGQLPDGQDVYLNVCMPASS